MRSEIIQWAIRNKVSPQALAELRGIFGLDVTPISSIYSSWGESGVQSRVRLEAAHKGVKLWRNNVGVLTDERGVPIRYGLANDSKRLNETIKSADLIGWRPITITAEMTGIVIAQFVSRECKPSVWKYTGTDREQAQLRWAELVTADGGDACFVTSEGTL